MKKSNKIRLILLIMGVILIASIFSSIALYFSTVSKQEVVEREEILIMSLKHLYNDDEDIIIEDIDEIRVLKAKAGSPPMNYNVALNMKNGDQILYSWTDETKSEVTHNANDPK